MGNTPEESQDNRPEFVSFQLIQDTLNLKNPTLFRNYLKEVFNDLGNSYDKNNVKYVSRFAFFDYIKLPILIAEKLFFAFAKSSQEGLCEEEFINGFYKLYMGTFEETIEIIFNIIDFKKDGLIQKEDAKLILSYLPLDENKEDNQYKKENQIQEKDQNNQEKPDLITKIFGKQIKSLEEIDTIIADTFDKFGGQMDLKEFTEIVIEKNSEIFLQILCFLYEKMPFNFKSLEALKEKYQLTDEENKDKSKTFKKSNSIRIKTPKKSSLLSPAISFLKQVRIRKLSLNEPNDIEMKDFTHSCSPTKHNVTDNPLQINLIPIKNDIEPFNEKETKMEIEDPNFKKSNDPYNKNIDIVRLDNDSTLEQIKESKDIKDLVESSKKGYTSPSKYLQDKNYLNHLVINNAMNSQKIKNFETQLRPIIESDENDKGDDNIIKDSKETEKDEENKVDYENWVYKLTESGKMRKFYLVLINKDIFYYKSNDKKEFVGMHNLSRCFVQESNENFIFEDKKYYIFEIIYKNKTKTRKYYLDNVFLFKEFVENIKKAIGYVKFSDLYEMKEVIGKGKFGVVNLGIHIKTGQQVAIKILNKANIKSASDKELVQMEIGILKLCHHPNIVRLLDHLENNDYIYIVTEYIEGGTLGNYLKKKKFNISERQALNIMSQIAYAVKYLHQYGIVHRDLKPDNIMMTQQSEYGVIKIMDFGLSKIISPNEKLNDGFGTLSYVAPEILLRSPYNKEVDIWSMGVILFYMLSGKLPFRGSKEKEVAEKIVYRELEFDENDWETRSQRVQDLITCCLEKKKEKRINIDQFINHPWLKKNMKQKYSM